MAHAMTAEALVGRAPLFLVDRRPVEAPAEIVETLEFPSKAIDVGTWRVALASQVELQRVNGHHPDMLAEQAALHERAFKTNLTTLAMQYEVEGMDIDEGAVPVPLAA